MKTSLYVNFILWKHHFVKISFHVNFALWKFYLHFKLISFHWDLILHWFHFFTDFILSRFHFILSSFYQIHHYLNGWITITVNVCRITGALVQMWQESKITLFTSYLEKPLVLCNDGLWPKCSWERPPHFENFVLWIFHIMITSFHEKIILWRVNFMKS